MAKPVKVAIVGDASQLQRELAKANGSIGGFGDKSKKDLETVGRAGLVAGGVLVAGLALAVKAASGFETEMSNLGAVSGATGEELSALRQQALDAGAATVFSASQAAEAQTELAKAGVATSDILGGALTGALNLASAGGLELATAAEIAANAMTTFNLSGSDVPRIADALAAGANKSAANVDDLGLALQQTGQVAYQTGLSMEDTVGVLAAFAQAGLKGSDAGTSLKTTLLRFNPTAKEARDLMKSLGIEFYDTQGNFVGITRAAGILQEKLGGLTQQQRNAALATIFGQDAIRGATILYTEGEAGISKWIEGVSDSGYAAELARKKLDNLGGDLEALRGSFETNLIEGGSLATTALRGLAQGATLVLNGFAELPGPLQVAGIGFTGILGSALLVGGAIVELAPKVETLKSALQGMGSLGPVVAANLGSIAGFASIAGVAMLALTFTMGLQAKASAEAAAAADAYALAINNANGDVDEAVAKQTAQNLSQHESVRALQDSSANWELFGRAIRDGGDELQNLYGITERTGETQNTLTNELRDAAAGGSELAAELIRLRDAGELSNEGAFHFIRTLENEQDAFRLGSREAATKKEVVDGLTGATDRATTAAGGLSGAEGDLKQKMDETTGVVEEQKSALEEYSDQLKRMFDPLFGLLDAQDDLEDSQKRVTEATLAALGAEQQFGRNSPQAIAAREDLTDAQRDAWKSAIDLEQANIDLADAVKRGEVPFDQASETIQRIGEKSGTSQVEIDQMKLALFFATIQAQEFDGEYEARVSVGGYITAFNQLTTLVSLGRSFAEAWAIAYPQFPEGVKPKYGGNAVGGTMDEGWSWVGERGPELVHKQGGAVSVMSAAESAGAGMGRPAQINVYLDKRVLTRALWDGVKDLEASIR